MSRFPLLALFVTSLVLPLGAARAEEDVATGPAWWLEQAAEAARKVDTPDGRAASLVSVAAGWLEAGEKGKAGEALAEALAYADACTGCFGKVQRLIDVALMQREAADEKGAAATLEKARGAAGALSGDAGARALASVAGAWLALGDDARAAALFDASTAAAQGLEAAERLEVFAAIAVARATGGDYEGAAASLDQLEKMKGDEVELLVSEVETAMADIALAGEDAPKALAYARDIGPLVPRVNALLQVARAAPSRSVAKDALKKAVGALMRIPDLPTRLLLTADAAGVLGAQGEKGEGERLLRGVGKELATLEDPEAQLEVMLRVVVGLGAVGSVDGARTALTAARAHVDEHVSARDLNYALEGLTQAAGDAGLLAEAEKIAAEIDALRVAVRAFQALADDQIRRGDTRGAMRSVHWLDTQLESWPEVFERRKDEALRAVAVLEARLGRLDRARKHFDRIERPFHRAAAATYVARVLAEKK